VSYGNGVHFGEHGARQRGLKKRVKVKIANARPSMARGSFGSSTQDAAAERR
jgi:hypothetical protein